MSQTAQSWWFVFYKDELLLEKKENGTFALPYGEIPPVFMIEKTTVHDVTTLEGSNCKAFSLARPIEESAKYVLVGLRASYECLPVAHYQQQGKHTKYYIGIETAGSVLPVAHRWSKRNPS